MSNKAVNRSESLESRPKAIGNVRNWLLLNLEANEYAQDDIFAIHLAVEEAFLNAVRHGNRNDSSKEVKVDCSIGPDKVEISMSDNGGGFNPAEVPDPRCGENLYKLQGRGLLLIRSYMDEVDFNECGNRIRMIKYRKKPSKMQHQTRA